MKTIRVSWNQLANEWITEDPAFNNEQLTLDQWADRQTELTPVRMLLAAENYSTHWVELPGVSGRHLARALPFALEESLIEDVSQYHIVAAGKSGSRVRAYAVSIDLVERLLEQAEHRHLVVRELIPESQCLPQRACVVWHRNGWLLGLPGVFEGWVMPFAVSAVLDSALEGESGLGVLQIQSPSRDQSNLLKTTIETGFADSFDNIDIVGNERPLLESPEALGRKVNLLSGQFQVRDAVADRPKAWWRPLAAMLVVTAVLGASGMALENRRINEQADQAYNSAVDLYKQLFPGERASMISRNFRTKLEEGGGASAGGFTSMVNRTAAALAESKISTLKLDSMRFNDRQGELIIEVVAANLADLQTLRQAIADKGLVAEVASASNDKNIVKGRIKIGEQA